MIKIALANLIPNGVRVEFYGITTLYLRDKRPFQEDVAILFKLLEEGQIRPVIAQRLPLVEARKANELLERGGVAGNLVLVAPG